MTPEDQLQFDNLKRELQDLKNLFFKDNFSDLEIFRKKVQFNAGLDIKLIDKTADTAPIADGNHAVSIPVGGGTITIATKNGIITNIT